LHQHAMKKTNIRNIFYLNPIVFDTT